MQKKYLLLLVVAILLIGVGYWFKKETSKPIPGQKLADLGRTHVDIGSKVEYNSNPPTSGPHYVNWVKAGFYDSTWDDRNLVHSLEHGYIIISYNCDFGAPASSITPTKTPLSTNEPESTNSGNLPESFKSEECKNLTDNLREVFTKKGPFKLIVIPRVNLDSKLALTAWTYIDKFNDFDESRITAFIDAHRDLGPEKTMEP